MSNEFHNSLGHVGDLVLVTVNKLFHLSRPLLSSSVKWMDVSIKQGHAHDILSTVPAHT